MVHKIKLSEDFAEAVLNGDKSFEIRNNDRGYQKGDTVIFKVVERGGMAMEVFNHPLNGIEFEITYVLNGWGLKDGFVAFGIRRANDG